MSRLMWSGHAAVGAVLFVGFVLLVAVFAVMIRVPERHDHSIYHDRKGRRE